MLPRRVVETKGISIDREILLRVVVYEPGVKKEDVKIEGAIESISEDLEGQNVTPLVESIGHTLSRLGVYDKE